LLEASYPQNADATAGFGRARNERSKRADAYLALLAAGAARMTALICSWAGVHAAVR
jgi:hypothetical protein